VPILVVDCLAVRNPGVVVCLVVRNKGHGGYIAGGARHWLPLQHSEDSELRASFVGAHLLAIGRTSVVVRESKILLTRRLK
jgi:hypothetical protein